MPDDHDRWTLPVRERRRNAPTHLSPSPARSAHPREPRRWPPAGHSLASTLDAQEAHDLVCAGAATVTGHVDDAPSAPPGHYRFYAVIANGLGGCGTDVAAWQHEAFADVSLALAGGVRDGDVRPWASLEQPCMAYAFGKRPGTVTLNWRVGRAGSLRPVHRYGAEVRPRRIKLMKVLDRLRVLEGGIREDDPDELYHSLYSSLLEDPEVEDNPHVGIEMQMTDLLTVLTNNDWIDFSKPKNQVVAKFFDSQDPDTKHRFFHQLLLAVELHLRIHSPSHHEIPKRQLLAALPQKVLWDLALATRWLANMTITKRRTASNQSTFSFSLRSKARQKDALLAFAQLLKWPNMAEVSFVLEESSTKEGAVEDRSADCMSFFTAVVLPGPTLPWLLINSLIDCDRDTGPHLNYLTHMHPAAGFQYRANTYFSASCVVGKVLGAARGVASVAGWIGPCCFSPDLKRTECVRVRQRQSPECRVQRRDVETMRARSEPLGPEDPDQIYPVNDFLHVLPETEDVADAIRVERLRFVPCAEQPRRAGAGGAAGAGANGGGGNGGPLLFDAAVVFACGGDSWPLRLRYDVDFLAAGSCVGGPHPLFYDYRFRSVRVDDGLVDVVWGEGWEGGEAGEGNGNGEGNGHGEANGHGSEGGGTDGRENGDPATATTTALSITFPHPQAASTTINTILLISALGVSDNEVFARAWCADRGHSAVVARLGETCLACAVRVAYAACVGVVIVTEGGVRGEV